jgi:hypothetical protein
VGVAIRDTFGNTAVCTALECGFLDEAMMLLSKDADLTILKHGTPLLSSVSTPMLEAIVDDCVESNGEPVTGEDTVPTFKYEFLNKIMPHMPKNQHYRSLLTSSIIKFLEFKMEVNRRFFPCRYIYVRSIHSFVEGIRSVFKISSCTSC